GFPFPLPFGDGGFPFPMQPGGGGPAWARSASEVSDAFAAARGTSTVTVKELRGRTAAAAGFSVGQTVNVTVDPATRSIAFASSRGPLACRFDGQGADLALGNASSSAVFLLVRNPDRSACTITYDTRARRVLSAGYASVGGGVTVLVSGR
ncbi:MAG: hypothetical protein IT371_31905, partial [Deltaproteobacteria bacterium]|nr:hypothetical protein [Deltaproteobacteria bacterium]